MNLRVFRQREFGGNPGYCTSLVADGRQIPNVYLNDDGTIDLGGYYIEDRATFVAWLRAVADHIDPAGEASATPERPSPASVADVIAEHTDAARERSTGALGDRLDQIREATR